MPAKQTTCNHNKDIEYELVCPSCHAALQAANAELLHALKEAKEIMAERGIFSALVTTTIARAQAKP